MPSWSQSAPVRGARRGLLVGDGLLRVLRARRERSRERLKPRDRCSGAGRRAPLRDSADLSRYDDSVAMVKGFLGFWARRAAQAEPVRCSCELGAGSAVVTKGRRVGYRSRAMRTEAGERRPRRVRPLGIGFSVSLLTLMIAHACASSDESSGSDFSPPAGGSTEDAGPDRHAADTSLPDASEDTPSESPDELCGGETASCKPEDTSACADGAPAAGAAGSNGTESPLLRGCQVQVGDDGASTACQAAGVGEDGDPCVSPADCAPGYTCSGETGASQCRLYCCSGSSICPEESYCTERPMRDVTAQAAPRVPVCVPATPCSLDEPFPCDPATDGLCTCGTGTACMVVRDGLASCATPGTGEVGDLCPCAPGHVCSQTLGVCLALCHLSGIVQSECGDGECQSASSIPDGYGVCVGGSS